MREAVAKLKRSQAEQILRVTPAVTDMEDLVMDIGDLVMDIGDLVTDMEDLFTAGRKIGICLF